MKYLSLSCLGHWPQGQSDFLRFCHCWRSSRTLQPYAPRGQVTCFSSKLGRKLGIDLGNENTWICVARVRFITFKRRDKKCNSGGKKVIAQKDWKILNKWSQKRDHSLTKRKWQIIFAILSHSYHQNVWTKLTHGFKKSSASQWFCALDSKTSGWNVKGKWSFLPFLSQKVISSLVHPSFHPQMISEAGNGTVVWGLALLCGANQGYAHIVSWTVAFLSTLKALNSIGAS